MSSSHDTTEVEAKTTKKTDRPADRAATIGSLVYFPLLFVYLEMVFHLYMNLNMRYAPIFLSFGIAAGLVCTLFTSVWKEILNRIIACVLTVILCLLFCIEMVCKTVLAQYYQLLSAAETAAGNHLTDYMDAILEGIADNLLGMILMLLPVLFLSVVGLRLFRFRTKNWRVSVLVASLAIIVHLFGLLLLQFPWKGDIVPGELYNTDTQVEDQVEQLGLFTMLRLDVKHFLFGVSGGVTDAGNFEGLDEVLNGASGGQTSTGAQGGLGDLSSAGVPGMPGDGSSSGAQGTAGQKNEEKPVEEPVDTSPNVMDVDFDALIASAPNDEVKWLHQYFQSVTPTNKNKYTGMFEGYNVIFITAEGFTGYMIDEELTPTLYKLSHEGFVFTNFYSPLHYTSTSGGEFRNLTGLYPKNGNYISMKKVGTAGIDMHFCLAQQLNRLGYESLGFHANGNMYGRLASHTQLGYQWIQKGTGFTMETDGNGKELWPQSDLYLMEQSVDTFLNSEKPFNVYYLTLSGHMPYNFSGNKMAIRNREAVADLPYSETTKAYIAANLELEKGLTYLLQRLEEAGIADKTLLVLAPDHIPYDDPDVIEELAGKNFGAGDELEQINESGISDFDIYKNTLILWSGSMEEPVVVDKVCGQVDILPTVSNLLGLPYDSRMLAGVDVLSDSSAVVIFSSRCWKTDKGFYNRFTETFTPAAGVSMTAEEQAEYVEAVKQIVQYKLQASQWVVDNDYYRLVFE